MSEDQGGARSCQEKPGRARKSQEEPGGARRSQKELGGARRSQEEPEGARRTKEDPCRCCGLSQHKLRKDSGNAAFEGDMALPLLMVPSEALYTFQGPCGQL